MTAPASGQTVAGRRREFVTFLYGVYRNLTADNRYAAADSRAVLARLRRSFAGPRQQAEAYQIIFDFDPPEGEQHVWLLVGGLFALHPRPRPASGERGMSIGAAMGTLAEAGAGAASRRFMQLISVERHALAYYPRQAVQLLRRPGRPGLLPAPGGASRLASRGPSRPPRRTVSGRPHCLDPGLSPDQQVTL